MGRPRALKTHTPQLELLRHRVAGVDMAGGATLMKQGTPGDALHVGPWPPTRVTSAVRSAW
ncbi:hypothetical protein [Pseudaquabacterium pictum]|uniref:Uncharacterized protein n=1 Tax=Pseudaquabacterium pictum TaxID=2315236 RepID=A0A480ARR4_9BURK|nr:hypothetical protein [Rubrivivax pictus]GCL62987.1 hypothetical protein AQPW35_20680 [Rubrivivax pictus]